VQLRAADLAIYRPARTLPATAGLLRLEGSAVITSTRQVGAALEVRMFNPHTKKITATLRLTTPPVGPRAPRVQRVNLEGAPLGSMDMADGAVRVTLKPKQIVTLSLTDLG
jgi:hypothetical protein